MSTPRADDKSSSVAYLCWLCLGVHYLYFRKPWLQLLYWVTLGGLGVWALIDLFRIPEMTDVCNGCDEEEAAARTEGRLTFVAVVVIALVAIDFVYHHQSEIFGNPEFAAATPPPAVAPIPVEAPAKSTGDWMWQEKRTPLDEGPYHQH